MPSELAEICLYCTRLLVHSGASKEVHHWCTMSALRESSSCCDMCKILFRCLSERLEDALKRFPQFDASDAQHFIYELQFLERSISPLDMYYSYVVGGVRLPNKFLYQFGIHVAALQDSAETSSTVSTWMKSPTTWKDKFDTLRDWFHTCETEHVKCAPQFSHSLPSRLIELDIDGVDGPRLVSTASLPSSEIRYTTLSYCWGNEVHLRTTKATVEGYHVELPHEELPKTFTDAISITRKLGLRYLWIDALCIIQDDKEDWRAEAAKMYGIYSGSSLTISASESESAQGGFLAAHHSHPIGNSTNERAFMSAKTGDTGSIFHIHMVPDEGVRVPALGTRGWAFQEAILSSRVITILNSELMWRCRSGVLSELGIQYRKGTKRHRAIAPSTEAHGKNWHRVWWGLMEEYTSRRFTYPEDRLPAMLGVIERYSHAMGDDPILGLWKSSLNKDICWARLAYSSGRPPNGHLGWNMPSWSPFACDQTVELPHWLDDELWEEPNDFSTEILACEVTWSGPPYLSSIASAHLKLLARLQRIYLAEATELNDCNPPYFNVDNEQVHYDSKSVPWRCAVQWDKEGQRPPQEWLCMLLATRQTKGVELGTETFLVLEEVQQPTYRRIGIGSLGHPKPLEGESIKKAVPKFISDVFHEIILV